MHLTSPFLPLLLAIVSVAPHRAADETKKSVAFVPLLSNDEAWKRLPKPDKGAGQPLPVWALATADALPRTTAAMLELDYLHRVDSPLPNRLRGMMRWTAARANRCAYTQAQALADLRLAGVDPSALDLLLKTPHKLPPVEREAVEFARKMTSAAYTVTDEEVAALIKTHGEKTVVGMVQLLAYSNFQDRLILSLGLASQAPLPALEVQFPKRVAGGRSSAPARIPVKPPPGPEPPAKITDPEWLALDYDGLQKNLVGQRARAPASGCQRRKTWPNSTPARPAPSASSGRWSAWATSPSWPRRGAPAPRLSARRRSKTASSRRAASGS